MRIKIKSAEVLTRTVKRKSDGQPFTFREQDAIAFLGELVMPVTLGLADNQSPYAVGDYTVDLEASLYVDRNRHLTLGRLTLKPAAAVRAA